LQNEFVATKNEDLVTQDLRSISPYPCVSPYGNLVKHDQRFVSSQERGSTCRFSYVSLFVFPSLFVVSLVDDVIDARR
jgi:hypothetical protein